MLFPKLDLQKHTSIQNETPAVIALPEVPKDFTIALSEPVENTASNLLKWKIDTLISAAGSFIRINNQHAFVNGEIKRLNAELGNLVFAKTEAEKTGYKKELNNALKELRAASITTTKGRAELEKLAARAVLSAKEAKAYYKVIFDEEAIKKMGQDVERQLEQVYYQPVTTAGMEEQIFEKMTTGPQATMIYSTPNVQPAHTYSFDYQERPGPSVRVQATAPTSTGAPRQQIVIDHLSTDIPDKPCTPPAPQAQFKVKKVLKIVRI